MHNIQLVKIQPEERLAAPSERNLAPSLVTGCGEARGMGYWAATQVKESSHEIFIVPEADVVLLTEGSTLIADSLIGTWQGDASRRGLRPWHGIKRILWKLGRPRVFSLQEYVLSSL